MKKKNAHIHKKKKNTFNMNYPYSFDSIYFVFKIYLFQVIEYIYFFHIKCLEI